MNAYYSFLEIVFGHQPCTKFHLEHLEHGRHKGKLEECIMLKYVQECGKNQNGDNLYKLTDLGLKIVNNPNLEGKQ